MQDTHPTTTNRRGANLSLEDRRRGGLQSASRQQRAATGQFAGNKNRTQGPQDARSKHAPHNGESQDYDRDERQRDEQAGPDQRQRMSPEPDRQERAFNKRSSLN